MVFAEENEHRKAGSSLQTLDAVASDEPLIEFNLGSEIAKALHKLPERGQQENLSGEAEDSITEEEYSRRASWAYLHMMKEGKLWRHPPFTHSIDKLLSNGEKHEKGNTLGRYYFEKLSEKNVQSMLDEIETYKRVQADASWIDGLLYSVESALQKASLCHYTNNLDFIEKDKKSRPSLLSKEQLALRSRVFKNNTEPFDDYGLANTDFVFLFIEHSEAEPRERTRFGSIRVAVPLSQSRLLSDGWIILADIVQREYPTIEVDDVSMALNSFVPEREGKSLIGSAAAGNFSRLRIFDNSIIPECDMDMFSESMRLANHIDYLDRHSESLVGSTEAGESLADIYAELKIWLSDGSLREGVRQNLLAVVTLLENFFPKHLSRSLSKKTKTNFVEKMLSFRITKKSSVDLQNVDLLTRQEVMTDSFNKLLKALKNALTAAQVDTQIYPLVSLSDIRRQTYFGEGGKPEKGHIERLMNHILVGPNIVPGLAMRMAIEIIRIEEVRPRLAKHLLEKSRSSEEAMLSMMLKDFLRPQAMIPHSVSTRDARIDAAAPRRPDARD